MKKINKVACYLLSSILVALIVACVISVYEKEQKLFEIPIHEYNELLEYKKELIAIKKYNDNYNRYYETLASQNENYIVENNLFYIPQTEYQMIQYNIILKYFGANEYFELVHTTCHEQSGIVIYEIRLIDTEEKIDKTLIETLINDITVNVKNEWLQYGYVKDAEILILDNNNLEQVVMSSCNGEITFDYL